MKTTGGALLIDLEGDLTPEARRYARDAALDGILTDYELITIMQIKSPETFSRKLDEIARIKKESRRRPRINLDPQTKQKVVFLSIVSPSVFVSAIALIIGML